MRRAMVVLLIISAVFLNGFDGPSLKKDRFYYEKKGEIVWEVPMQEKKVALTFDDGPYPPSTEPILDLLKSHGAKATFFVVGNRIRRYPELILREQREGHEIANHTYNHKYFNRHSDSTMLQDEIVKTEAHLQEMDIEKPKLFRPPGGYYNEAMVRKVRSLGYTTVLWSWHQDTKDWRKPGVQAIVDRVMNHVRNGDIILFHDYVPGSMETVEALKLILPALNEQGYQCVTVTELLHSRNSLPIDTTE